MLRRLRRGGNFGLQETWERRKGEMMLSCGEGKRRFTFLRKADKGRVQAWGGQDKVRWGTPGYSEKVQEESSSSEMPGQHDFTWNEGSWF